MLACSIRQTVPSISKSRLLGFRLGRRDAAKNLGGCCLRLRTTTAAAALSSSEGHPQQQQQQQQQCWFQTEQAESLRQVFKLPPYRFQTLVNQEPNIIFYQADTLALTLQALSEALFSSHKAVVQVVERRPSILLQPAQPRMVLQQLATLLDRSPPQTAFLLAPYPHLLALPPQQLQGRINGLCDVLSVPPQHLQAAIAEASAPSFLHLLALPVQNTARQLSDLCAALEADPATVAQLVLFHPHLLGMSAAVLRSRVFALSDAAGMSCRKFMRRLDDQQVKGLAGLLLLSPGRLLQQLAGVESLLEGRQSRDVAVWLLLRLGLRVSLPEAQVMMVALQGVCRKVPDWQQQLLSALDLELSMLLSAGHEQLAQAMYLAASQQAHTSGLTLLQTVHCDRGEFRKKYGEPYEQWLAGKNL